MDCPLQDNNKDAILTPEEFKLTLDYYTQQINNQLNLIECQTIDVKCWGDAKAIETAAAGAAAAAATAAVKKCVHSPQGLLNERPSDNLTSKECINEKLKANGSIKKNNLYLKSLEKSITFRNRGNELFNNKKYSDAIVLYNLAIINGPFDTVEDNKRISTSVSLALANRSLCHGYLDHVEGAIDDAEAAIQLGYPHVAKVTSRIAAYQKRLQDKQRTSGVEHKGQRTTVKSKVTRKEDDLVDANKFTLFTDQMSGRGLKAACNLPVNTVILRETAYCAILDYDRFTDFCYQCLVKLTSNHFYPCYTCTQVRFCSLACANECVYHSHECHLIELIKFNTNESNLAYRLSLRIILSENAADIMDALNQSKEQVEGEERTSVSNGQGNSLPARYLGLLSLVDHQPHQHPLTKVTAFLTAFTLNRRSDFTQFFNTLQLTHVLASLFLKHARQVKWNAMSISHRSLMPSDFNINVNILKEELIGVGIFHIQLLINHSCSPNIKTAKFNGRQVTLAAIESISCGDEILNSYGMFSKWQGFHYRQEYLQNSYAFKCNCRSCSKQIEPLIRAYRCYTCNGPILIESLEDISPGSQCFACHRLISPAELANLKKGQIAANQTICAAVKYLSEYLNELEETDDSDDDDEDGHFRVISGKNQKKILMIEQLLHTGHRKLTQVLYKDHRDCVMTLDTIVAFYIRVKDCSKFQSALLYANHLLDYTKRVFDEDVHLFNTYLKVMQVYSHALKYSRRFEEGLSSPSSAHSRNRGETFDNLTLKSNLIRLTSEAINLLHQIIEGSSETFSYFMKHFNECLE